MGCFFVLLLLLTEKLSVFATTEYSQLQTDDKGANISILDNITQEAGGDTQRFYITAFKWHHVAIPMTISLWIFIVCIAKIVFHLNRQVASLFPESALLIVLGLLIGAVLFFLDLNEQYYLYPSLFFLYLLPPIVLDAGYFLPTRAFFQNIFTILLYAVVGTIWNTVAIGLTLYFSRSLFTFDVTFIQIFLFSCLISAVDPVAVLGVFEEIHVNQLLYICVLGESLLNDAISVVLYKMFGSFARIGAANLLPVDYFAGLASFFFVSFGGIALGLFWALFTGFVTKYTNQLTVIQPLIVLIFPYLSYLCAELFNVSGILAIVTCGLIMRQYVSGNISEESRVTVTYFMKTLSSCCEAVIFLFLGLSAVTSHSWDHYFVFFTVVACLLFRFIGVFALTGFVNIRRLEKIRYVDQFIMAYGGLRGAVAYGLVVGIDSRVVPAKNFFVTTAIFIILFTVFIQGMTMKPLVYFLNVKLQQDDKHKSLVQRMFENMQDHILAGVEEITGYRGHYWFKNVIEGINNRFIKPCLMRQVKRKGYKIIETYEHLHYKDAMDRLRKKEHDKEERPAMPHVETIANFVVDAIPGHLPRYSRQLMESDIERLRTNAAEKSLRRRVSSRAKSHRYPANVHNVESSQIPLTSRCRHFSEGDEIRKRRNANPSNRQGHLSPTSGRHEMEDEDSWNEIDNGTFVKISGPVRKYRGYEVPVLPIYCIKRDGLSGKSGHAPSSSQSSALPTVDV